MTTDHRFNPAPFCAKCSGPCRMAADDACSRCGAELSPIDRDNEHDTRKGEPGDLRCTDETCPYSDYPQGYRFTEG